MRSRLHEFKAKVAIEAIRGVKTVSELASDFDVQPVQISQWKRKLLDQAPGVFTSGPGRAEKANERLIPELYEEIARLKMELDWAKKKLHSSVREKRALVEWSHPSISIRRQCQLLGLNRSTLYYEMGTESPEDLKLMRKIDEQYLRTPFYGSRRLAASLGVNRKRIQRPLGIMGLMAIYPGPKTSRPAPGHKIYPYLLRGLVISRPFQVWSADVTYIPLRQGFMYLVAILDWFSRYVISWRLSNTLGMHFCVAALQDALREGVPEIFNTDQGQFTSSSFVSCVQEAGALMSMDRRGRALDNVSIERLWRTVKYEEVYLKDYETVPELQHGLLRYFEFYNHERVHQSLGYQVPASVHFK